MSTTCRELLGKAGNCIVVLLKMYEYGWVGLCLRWDRLLRWRYGRGVALALRGWWCITGAEDMDFKCEM